MGGRRGREAGGEMLMALLPRVVYIMSHSTCGAVFYELVSCSPCVAVSLVFFVHTHTAAYFTQSLNILKSFQNPDKLVVKLVHFDLQRSF